MIGLDKIKSDCELGVSYVLEIHSTGRSELLALALSALIALSTYVAQPL